jgi:hypothetical protein
MPDVQRPWRQRRRRSEPFVRPWRDLLVPTESLEVPRPRGLRHATYQRLVNEYNRLLEEIAALPRRQLWPRMRKAYEHQFLNRIVRIRRRLGLPTPEPLWHPAPAAFRVRVWAIMSRGRGPRRGCPPPEGVDVAYPPVHNHFLLSTNSGLAGPLQRQALVSGVSSGISEHWRFPGLQMIQSGQLPTWDEWADLTGVPDRSSAAT